MTPIPHSIISALETNGYSIYDDFLPDSVIRQLAQEARDMAAAGTLKPARVGLQAQSQRDIRGDLTHWLEDRGDSPAQQHYTHVMNELCGALNRSCFLGLHTLETHFAVYPPGTAYGRHLDQFRDSQQRIISSILYLNDDWSASDGGQLRLYLEQPERPHLDVVPHGNRLVLFESARFWHEVLPASRERISLTGWFRARDPSPL
ncbi:2OG-Fe(II) oxygenase [Pseudomethylobacillus aquaticus]|uniref:2OG-Fe(II) oxygenase n=1 Tax=Pseudomethylobacillus aquaticus TaxID=2676064 RepID=A0A3N0V054_9PROT|nr:2OG-Fe(II) oxygenase [Pseudomethylobacillus aquaticus]ROH86186.1 2OG-Fe(II) oxygenase [Pseudomethylobacillus aquaticus]